MAASTDVTSRIAQSTAGFKRTAVLASLVLVFLVVSGLPGQTPIPSREYVRLGDRVVAIESPDYMMSLSEPYTTIGSLDTLTITANVIGCTVNCTVTWSLTTGSSYASIVSTGPYTALLTPLSSISSPQSVTVRASLGNGSATTNITIQPVLQPQSSTFGAEGGTGSFVVFKLGNWTAHSNAGWITLTGPTQYQSQSGGDVVVTGATGAITLTYAVAP